jgi:hypothetical protein
MIRTPLSLLLALAASSAPAMAGDLTAHYLNWNYEVEGFASDSDSRFDFSEDLDIKVRQKSLLALTWDTGPGWWPNLSASYVPVQAGGRKTVTTQSSFLGIPTGSQSANVIADADLDDIDLSLHYPLQLGSLAISLGATLKKLEGTLVLQEEGDDKESRERVDETFPMGRLGLHIAPWHWLLLDAHADYVAYQGNRASNLGLQAALRLGDLSLALGWQERNYRVDTSSYRVDADLAGVFAGIGLVLR